MKSSTLLYCLALVAIVVLPLNAQLQYEQFVYEGYGSPFLDNASSVSVSPDGQHLYITSFDDMALSLFERNLNTGGLTYIEAYRNGVEGVGGLEGTQAVLVSPDGRHVYASGFTESALVVFERDEFTGKLSLVEILRDNEGGISGMDGALKIRSTKDGNYIYLVSPKDNSVTVFKRNVITGELSTQQLVEDGGNGGNDMTYPLDMVLSPDGKHAYVTSFGDHAITVFSVTPENGTLVYINSMVDGQGNVDGIDGATAIAISPDGKYVFASGENSLVVFQRASSTGQLNYLTKYTDGIDSDALSAIEGIGISKTGNNIYTLSALDDAITIFGMNQLTGNLTEQNVIQNGTGGVNGLDYPTNLAFANDFSEMYVTSLGGNGLLHFDVDNSNGDLTFKSVINSNNTTGLSGIEGTSSLAISPDNQHVYVAGEIDDALSIFERDENTGMLNYLGMIEDGSANDGLNGVKHLTLSPDGNHLYAAGFWDASIAMFQRDASTGMLDYLGRMKDGLFGTDGLSGVSKVILSPDGMFVYSAAALENGIGVFSRNTSNGMLDYEAVYFDGVLGVDGIEGVVDLAISADGQYLYAAGSEEASLSLFQRDIATGLLTFVERLKDGEAGLDGLDGILAIDLSPDGQFLYTASEDDNSVNVFAISQADGTLTPVTLYQDLATGGMVEALAGVTDLQVSPDGSYLYVAAFEANAVSVFSRDVMTGELEQLSISIDGVENTNGIEGTSSINLSSTGKHIYATGFSENAVGIFSCTLTENLVITICEGDSYSFGGQDVFLAGQYEYIEDNGACVTTVTLDLLVSPVNTSISVEICEGDVYKIGTVEYATTGEFTQTLISNSGCDSLVNLNLTVVNEFALTEFEATVCNGESYEWGSNIYTESGAYEVVLSSAFGCDSVVLLSLTVLPELEETISVTACDEQFYVFGTSNYIEDGIYSNIFISENGCDSTVTMQLGFAPTSYYLEEEICQGSIYIFGEDTLTTAGTYDGEVILNSGCEVAVNLVLSVLPAGSSTIEASICQGAYFVFDNVPYYDSGTYQAAYASPNGCDSIVTLELTVNEVEVFLGATICEGASYEVGAESYDQTGVYEIDLDSYNGCDSTVYLTLTVTPIETQINATICAGELYELDGMIYDVDGVYEQLITNSSGCETMVTLSLEVLSEIASTVVITNDNGISNGGLDISPSGGQTPYSYLWNTGSTEEDLTGLSEGTYSLTITDGEGCTAEFNYEVGFTTSTDIQGHISMTMDLIPNLVSSGGRVNVTITSAIMQDIEMKLLDNKGQVLKSSNLSLRSGSNTHTFEAPSEGGMYYIQLSYEGTQEVFKFIVYN